jgi:hypothetical protein
MYCFALLHLILDGEFACRVVAIGLGQRDIFKEESHHQSQDGKDQDGDKTLL